MNGYPFLHKQSARLNLAEGVVMEEKKFFICPACKERSFIKIKKDFDGFKAIAKKKTCALCSYEFKEDEEVSFLEEKPLFDDMDKEKNSCRDCQHYIENPYTQRCMLHKKEVTAFDDCSDFVKQEVNEFDD